MNISRFVAANTKKFAPFLETCGLWSLLVETTVTCTNKSAFQYKSILV